MWVFGNNYREKNQFQWYYTEIVKAVETDDWLYFKQLKEELTLEQYLYIWRHLASYTRSKIKEMI